MTVEGVDALGHPSPAALVAAGKRFVCCYLKDTDRPLIDAYLALGIKVVLISETTGRRSLGGGNAGQADAHAAARQLDVLKAPDNVVIYFAEDDLDVSTAELPTVVQYSRGLYSVFGERAGWYGGLRTVEAVMADGRLKKFWQTYGWSAGKWAAGISLEQYLNGQSLAGTGVDFDRALAADFGAWLPPQQQAQEEDVPLTGADGQVIAPVIADTVWTRLETEDGKPLGDALKALYSKLVLHANPSPALDTAAIVKAVTDAIASHPTTASVDPAPIAQRVLDGLAGRLAS